MKLLGKKEVGQRRVYDIEVEDVHNFYANGVNVHNCATAGGVSVIKDDGTVVDSASTTTYSSIFFSSDYYLYALDTTFADDVQAFGDVAGITADGFTAEAIYWEQTTNAVKLSDDIITDASEYPNGFAVAAQGVRPGLNTVYENRSAYTEGMVAYTTSTYNTGWMNGDIKGAFLSDTDDTDLVGGADNDRSVNANPLTVNGTVTRSPVATGADLVDYSGFSASNYLEQPYNSDLDFGTGDFCIMGWVQIGDTLNKTIIDNRDASGNDGFLFAINSGFPSLLTRDAAGNTSQTTATTSPALNSWAFLVAARTNSGATQSLYINGALSISQAVTARSLGGSADVTLIGRNFAGGNVMNGSLALLRISATAPTAEQIAKIYNDEKVLFQENAQATLYGASDAVTALAHDPDTDLLHAGTSAGRSVFEGLRRVGNTTTSVSTSISASGGLIVEK